MIQCEGLIPESRVERLAQPDEDHSHQFEDNPHLPNGACVVYETVPARPCEAEATMLSRSMRELEDGAWEPVKDTAYCASCFVPGVMTHADGSVSQHPAMAVGDA